MSTNGDGGERDERELVLPEELAALDLQSDEPVETDSVVEMPNLGSVFGDGEDLHDARLLGDDAAGADHLSDVTGEDLTDLGHLRVEEASRLGDLLADSADESPSFPTSFFSNNPGLEVDGPSGSSDVSSEGEGKRDTVIKTVVDPIALQLVGTGVTDDHYLRDGRHLRWTFGSDMGFPRSGFRLYRRPSPPEVSPKEVFAVRRSPKLETQVENGRIRTSNGLRVNRPDGVSVDDSNEGVELNQKPLSVRFAESGATEAPEMTACWVELDFKRRRNTGSVAAVAVADEGGDARVQDRGGVGPNLQMPFDPLPITEHGLETIRRVEDVPVLEPHADGSSLIDSRGGGDDGDDGGSVGGEMFDSDLGSHGVGGFGSSGWQPPVLPDEWADVKLVLNGSHIDEIQTAGTDAVLTSVSWLPVSDYADADGWTHVETFRLPIRGDDTFYPRASRAGETIARDRLRDAPPKALPPWDEQSWPPSPDPAAVETDQEKRYLGDGHDRLEDALDEMLKTEMTDAVRQESVTREATLSPTTDSSSDVSRTTPDELEDSRTEVGLLGSVLTAAVDPQQATALGLATAETDRLDERFDYKIEADWPLVWWYERLASQAGESVLSKYRNSRPDDDGIRLPVWESGGSKPTTVLDAFAAFDVKTVSVATDVAATRSSPVDSPTGLSATVTPTPGRAERGTGSVPANVELEWDADPGNLFTGGGHVAYAVRREYEGTDEPLHHDDPDTGVTLPHMHAADGPASVTDRDLPGWGTVTYRVSGMDVWGRFSDFAELTVEVTDEAAPPAPTGLTAELAGDPDDASWSLELSFDWAAGQRALAPDATGFEILCEQGRVEPTTAGGTRGFDGWDRAEVAPGSRERVRVAWPSLSIAHGRSGVTAWVDDESALGTDDKDARISVSVPDVTVPFDGDEAELSVTVVAVDSHGNPSNPTTPDAGDVARRAVASRTAPKQPAKPSLPPGPQRTTWPDAEGECHWTCSWASQPSGSQTRVLRASQARLLSTAGVAHDEFAAKSPDERARTLRRFAADNQQVFSPDHRDPYDHNATEHTVSVGATDRGWTVVTPRHTGPTGTKSPWPGPDGFAVVAPRTARRPSTPRLSAEPAVNGVKLHVAPDPSGTAANVRLYRTPDPDATGEIRRMRPLAFPNTAGGAADVPVHTNQRTTVTDDVPYADRWYAYRAVAESASGERSPPTEPMWVRASSDTPPPKPTVKSVEAVHGADLERRVTVEVTGYGLDLRLARTRAGVDDWTAVERGPVDDLTVLSRSPGTRTVEVIDEVPAADASWAFTYSAVVEDRRGRTATSDDATQGGNQ